MSVIWAGYWLRALVCRTNDLGGGGTGGLKALARAVIDTVDVTEAV